MFLKKIIKLRNVGKFHQGGVSGGEYGKYTLFYAGNGRGKTTICAVLRSMKANDPSIILERRTLGEVAAPEAQLLLDSGVATFGNGAWKNRTAAVHVFDGAFVTANVHAGEEISADHRRSIYRVIVGAKGVQLAEEVDALDAKVTEATTNIGSAKRVLQQHVPPSMAFEKFLGLAEDLGIDVKITEQKAKIAAASQAAAIAAKSLLNPSAIPALPTAFVTAIEKTIEGVSKDVAKKVAEHLSKHQWEKNGEAWIAAGLPHVQDDKCPFCENSVEGNALVDLYRQYFDESYAALKSELASLQATALPGLSEAEGLKAKGRFDELEKAVQYWTAFGKVDFLAAADLDGALAKLAALYGEAKKAIEAKITDKALQVSTFKKTARGFVPEVMESQILNTQQTAGPRERSADALGVIGKDVFARLGLLGGEGPALRRVLEPSMVSVLACRVLGVPDHAGPCGFVVIAPFQAADFGLAPCGGNGEIHDGLHGDFRPTVASPEMPPQPREFIGSRPACAPLCLAN